MHGRSSACAGVNLVGAKRSWPLNPSQEIVASRTIQSSERNLRSIATINREGQWAGGWEGGLFLARAE